MFLKQYNYKPRTGSQSAGSDASDTSAATQTAALNANQQSGTVSAAVAGRRRSSATEGQFAGLQGYKRGSQDVKKEAFTSQQGQAGVLGQMWNNFTKGK